jgi:Family of unknown function (DUF6338)
MGDLLNPEKLPLFLVILLPGFVAIKVYDLLAPPEKRDFGASLIEVAAYGVINFAIWAWVLVGLTLDGAKQNPLLYSLLLILICVLSPTVMAWTVYRLRKQDWVCYGFKIPFEKWQVKGLGVPISTAWDDFFGRNPECWVLCHLKNGKKIAGLFSEDSFATSYPQKQELYLEKTFAVNDDGKILNEIPGTMGMLVRYEDCHLIEFLTVEYPDAE